MALTIERLRGGRRRPNAHQRLTLATTDGGNGKNSDHADGGQTSLTCAP
jgi:hypothetical protein